MMNYIWCWKKKGIFKVVLISVELMAVIEVVKVVNVLLFT